MTVPSSLPPRLGEMGNGHDGLDAADSAGHPTSRVAVITVSYASGSVLPAFLDSIARSTEEPAVSIVVDNKPDDDAIARESRQRGARYLAAPDNPGYGGAINRGVLAVPPGVEWILVSNPDVVLGIGALDRLLEVADSDPRIGAVGPSIINPDGSVYPSARAIPSIGNGIGHALFANLWPTNPWTRQYHHDRPTSVPRSAGWLSGSCVLVRRTVFDAIGGFDDGYFMYFEDVDLGYRIGRLGYSNVYVPAATAEHLGGHSTASRPDAMVRAHHQSARRFLSKRYPGARYAPLRAVLGIGLAFRARMTSRRPTAR